METNVNYTLVGAFVISLAAAIVLGIIWLSSGFSAHYDYSYYKVYMQESVSGLNEDSAVEYNGVTVGSVTSIQLDQNDPHLVDLLLKIRSDTPITRGTRATLTTRGITGITFVALKDKSDDMRPLVAEKDQTYPVIPTSPSIFLRLDIVLTNLSSQIQKVSDAIESLLDKENQASIKATLSSMRDVTGMLAENNEKMTAILINTARASERLGPLILSTQGTMLMLQNQTLPETYRLLSNLNDMARNLSAVSAQFKQNPSVIIRGVQPRTLGPGEHR